MALLCRNLQKHLHVINFFPHLVSGSLIRPYLFLNDKCLTETVNHECYKRITDYFCLEIEDINGEDMWFQQDGATSHTYPARLSVFA